MANNKIQIKRSTSNAVVTGLSNGELAFTEAGNVFFIGSPTNGTSIRIGGQMVPGTLTANQALVANATSGIDKVITANLAANSIWANGSAGVSQILYANSTGGAYWGTVPASSTPGGSDTQVQFNDGGSTLNATAGFTFSKASNNVTIANTLLVGNTTVNSVHNSSSFSVIGNTTTLATATISSTGFTLGNSTVTATSLSMSVANSTGNVQITSGTTSILATGLVNASAFTTTGNANATNFNSGANLTVNSASITYVGNSTTSPTITLANTGSFTIGNSTTTQTTSIISVANSVGNVQITPASVTINGGAVTVNSTGFYSGNTTDSTTGTGSFVATDTNILLGNNTINAVVNTSSLSIGGYGNATTGGIILNTTSLVIGNSSVNSSINSTAFSGTVLTANNASYLGGTIASGYQTTAGLSANVATLTSNNATNLGGVAAANYVNTTGTYSLSGNLTFTGANLVVSGTNTAISSNITLTGASITGTSTDVTLRNGTFSGNLVVSGTVITVNTQQLVVNDNIIELGLNNTTTDTVDTGFFSPAGNATNIWYSGFARIAAQSSNTNPVFRVFVSNTNPNTSSTIGTDANTVTGTLWSYLRPYNTGTGFVANATTVTITANSTVAVSITANSLSLSTPLSGNNGGTGLATTVNNSLYFGNSTNGFNSLALGTSGYVLQSNGTAIVYDVLDGGTF